MTTINDIYADLDKLVAGVAIQSLSSTSVPSELGSLLPTAGRANLRAKGSTTSKSAKVDKVETPIDALVGEEKYERPNGEFYYSRKWGEHSDIEALRKARSLNQFVLLYGSPGCGKTALVEGAFGSELETILGSGDTELSDFIGGYVQTPSGGFEWIDGALVRCAEQGKVLLIDEIGLIDPKVLSAVYGLMDGRKEIAITQNPERGTIKAQEGFYVVGATNPNAFGVRLSEALLSRFTIQVEMTTDWSLAKKLGVPAPAITASQNLAKKQATNEISWSPQFRELLAFRNISKEFGTNWAISNLVAVAPEIDRAVVADVFTRVFGVEVSPAKI
jgi:SpoVK/Ycf46/Vps4 family AAA+-type ATPase